MAWLDDLVWCKPSWLEVPDRSYRVWTHGLAYSSGLTTRGVLTTAQQRLIGSTPKIRADLVERGLWEEREAGAVYIRNWQERNGKRDERKEKDRNRKREARKSAGLSAGQDAGLSTVSARVERKTLNSNALKPDALASEVNSEGSGERFAARVAADSQREHHPYDPPTDAVAAIRRQIANGALADRVDLEAELEAHQVNGSVAAELRLLLPEADAAA